MLGGDGTGSTTGVHVGACGYVLSCQTFNYVVPRGPGSGAICLVLATPEHGFRKPGHVPSWVT
jgi:hypothetical protein